MMQLNFITVIIYFICALSFKILTNHLYKINIKSLFNCNNDTLAKGESYNWRVFTWESYNIFSRYKRFNASSSFQIHRNTYISLTVTLVHTVWSIVNCYRKNTKRFIQFIMMKIHLIIFLRENVLYWVLNVAINVCDTFIIAHFTLHNKMIAKACKNTRPYIEPWFKCSYHTKLYSFTYLLT